MPLASTLMLVVTAKVVLVFRSMKVAPPNLAMGLPVLAHIFKARAIMIVGAIILTPLVSLARELGIIMILVTTASSIMMKATGPVIIVVGVFIVVIKVVTFIYVFFHIALKVVLVLVSLDWFLPDFTV